MYDKSYMRQYDYTSLRYSVSKRELWDELLGNRQKIVTIVFILGLFIVAVILKAYVMILILGGVLAIAVVALVRQAITSVSLRRFAETNGLSYISPLQDTNLPGCIFQIGRNRHFEDGISDTKQYWLMANYNYTTGSGKSSRTYQYGVMHFKLARRVPHVLIQSLSGNLYQSLSVDFSSRQKMQLEGDFDTYFTTYAPVGYQRDALYFLTPEIMAILIDQGKEYSFEVIDDNLFIYSKPIDFSDKSLQVTMEKLLTVAQRFSDEFNDNTQRYADARVQNSVQLNTVGFEGRRLKKGTNWTSIASVGIIIALIAFIWKLSIG